MGDAAAVTQRQQCCGLQGVRCRLGPCREVQALGCAVQGQGRVRVRVRVRHRVRHRVMCRLLCVLVVTECAGQGHVQY